ncbi:MAG: DinB family protein [Acidobacteriota bacterium]
MIERPAASEYASFYAGYISSLPDGDILDILEKQTSELRQLAAATPADRETFRYADGKWSVREVVGHMIDGERVFSYRTLRFSRGDQTPLPGFEENQYVAASGFDRRPLASLVDELVLLRQANLGMLRALAPEAWTRTGTANNHPISVRALAFIMAGHVRHHLNILRDRYGVS